MILAHAFHARGYVLPPCFDDLTLAEQRGADPAGKADPGFQDIFRARRSAREYRRRWRRRARRAALSGGFLLGELVDHDQVDILRDRACDRDGSVGKTGGIQFARHGTAASGWQIEISRPVMRSMACMPTGSRLRP